MKLTRLFTIAISVLLVFFFFPILAAGETSLGIYGGIASPSDHKMKVGESTEQEEWDEGYTVGARLTYWFIDEKYSLDADWFGLALDASYFKTEADDIDLDVYVVPITALLMFRYPGDILQPYVGVGGGLFISYADGADFRKYGYSRANYSSDAYDFGFDARAGLAIKLWKVSIFGEGRYTYFEPHYKDKIAGTNSDISVSTDMQVYHLLAGIAYHF